MASSEYVSCTLDIGLTLRVHSDRTGKYAISQNGVSQIIMRSMELSAIAILKQ